MRSSILFVIVLVVETSLSSGQESYWMSWGSLPGEVTSLVAGTQGNVFAVVSGRGVFRGSPTAVSWIQLNNGLPYTTISSIAIAPNGDVYIVDAKLVDNAGNISQGIFRSTNQGETWLKCGDACVDYIFDVVVNPLTSNVFVSNGTFICRSTDSGSTWNNIFHAWYPSGIEAMYFSRTGDGYLQIFCSGSCYIWYQVWVIADSGQESKYSYSADRFSPPTSTIAQYQKYLFIGTDGGGLYRCPYASCTCSDSTGYPIFTQVNSGLNNLHITSIVFDSVDYAFVGTKDSGVFYSEDDGNHWTQINSGLIDSSISCLVVTSDNYLFASTISGQIFRSIKTTTSVKLVNPIGLPVKYSLEQNYPNPFNPSTIIAFSLTQSCMVHLSVYNLIGQEICNLISKELGSGSYNIKWDGSNQVSGVYFYRLQLNGIVQSKKMILLK